MYYLGHWKKTESVSIQAFEDKMKHFFSKNPNHEAFAGVLLDFHAYAGEYEGIEVIEVRGKGSDKALIERMKQLEPEVTIKWTPLINLKRQLDIK